MDKHILACRTRYGLLEHTVIQFATTYVRADFQGCINHSTREALDDLASAYLDNVLIYSVSLEKHIGHVKSIIQAIFDPRLYLVPETCVVYKDTVRYV
jgi:hypothetical protein